MKPAKVVLAIVLGVIALVFAWGLVTSALGLLVNVIRSIVGLAIGVAIIGGLGWVILRLIGKRPLSGNKYETLP